MPQVSDRYWIAYYAAQGGNWALAAYQLRRVVLLSAETYGELCRPFDDVIVRQDVTLLIYN